MDGTGRRKADHLRICREDPVDGPGGTGLDGFRFDHRPLPGLDLDTVDTGTTLLGRTLGWPFLVGAMTGGTAEAGDLNRRLSVAAEASGCGFSLGSLRAALEDPAALPSYDARAWAPRLPLLLGNIGAAQLAAPGIEGRLADLCRRLGLDGLVVHLNPLQEALQPEGDRDWRGLAGRVAALRDALAAAGVPLGLKEVGSGFSAAAAGEVARLRPALVETAGTGGTSWARVESRRAPDAARRRAGETFAGWGHSLAASLAVLRARVPGVPVVASGGLRDGLQLAVALRLGASAGAMARPLLQAAAGGAGAVESLLEAVRLELRVAMFAAGCRTLADLRRAPLRDPFGVRVPFARGVAP